MGDKLKAGDDCRDNWRTINECLDRLSALNGGNRNSRAGIAELRRRPRDSGASGWHWADPKEYDMQSPYSVDQVVLVSPSNPAVTDGDEFGVKAVAGIWVNCRSVDPDEDGVVHVPIWPEVADPDEEPWWKLISFYPTVMTFCTSLGSADYYVNAQPVPEEE